MFDNISCTFAVVRQEDERSGGLETKGSRPNALLEMECFFTTPEGDFCFWFSTPAVECSQQMRYSNVIYKLMISNRIQAKRHHGGIYPSVAGSKCHIRSEL